MRAPRAQHAGPLQEAPEAEPKQPCYEIEHEVCVRVKVLRTDRPDIRARDVRVGVWAVSKVKYAPALARARPDGALHRASKIS